MYFKRREKSVIKSKSYPTKNKNVAWFFITIRFAISTINLSLRQRQLYGLYLVVVLKEKYNSQANFTLPFWQLYGFSLPKKSSLRGKGVAI